MPALTIERLLAANAFLAEWLETPNCFAMPLAVDAFLSQVLTTVLHIACMAAGLASRRLGAPANQKSEV